MNDALGTAYAELREELAARARDVAWPTPEAGFVSYLLGDSRLALGLRLIPTNKRLSEAPILASNGYLYAELPISELGTLDPEWGKALERLLHRDPFPVDRESYFFRPLEILGICLGTLHCPSIKDAARNTLKGVLRTGQPRVEENDLWSYSLTSFAAWQLGVIWKRQSLPLLDNLTLDELCLVHWLLRQDNFCQDTGLECAAESLNEHVLTQCFTRMAVVTSPVKAAVTLLVTDDLVNTRISSSLCRTWSAPADTAAAEEVVGAICRRFHAFASQIRHRHDGRTTIEIEDEYDVQDSFHALLKLHFEDIRTEEWTPSYGGSSTRMDFLLKRERVVVEVKMTRKGLDQKGVVRQLTEDMERYRVHPDCKTLVCFVYDPAGICANPTALEDDLGGSRGSLKVIVHVAPKP